MQNSALEPPPTEGTSHHFPSQCTQDLGRSFVLRNYSIYPEINAITAGCQIIFCRSWPCPSCSYFSSGHRCIPAARCYLAPVSRAHSSPSRSSLSVPRARTGVLTSSWQWYCQHNGSCMLETCRAWEHSVARRTGQYQARGCTKEDSLPLYPLPALTAHLG